MPNLVKLRFLPAEWLHSFLPLAAAHPSYFARISVARIFLEPVSNCNNNSRPQKFALNLADRYAPSAHNHSMETLRQIAPAQTRGPAPGLPQSRSPYPSPYPAKPEISSVLLYSQQLVLHQ
jgi:hypothetical protein